MQSIYYFSPTGMVFYNSKIGDAVLIDSKVAEDLINRLKLGHILKVDDVGNPYTVMPLAYKSDIKLLYEYKIRTLSSDYEQACIKLRGEYPPTETVSFSLQLIEAIQYKQWMMSDRSSPAPMLFYIDKLSAERDAVNVGDGLEDLVNRILHNSFLYNTGMSKLTAYRHSLEKELKMLREEKKITLLEIKEWDFMELLRMMGI